MLLYKCMMLVAKVRYCFLAHGIYWFLECKGFRYINERARLCVCVRVCVCITFYNVDVTLCYMKCAMIIVPFDKFVSNVIRFVWIRCFMFTSYGPTTCFHCKLHLTSCNIVFSLFYCLKLLYLQYLVKLSYRFFFFFG